MRVQWTAQPFGRMDPARKRLTPEIHYVDKAGRTPHKHSCGKKNRGTYLHTRASRRSWRRPRGVRAGRLGARPGRTWLLTPRSSACPAADAPAWSAAYKLATAKSSPSKIRPKRYACWERGEARTHGSLCGKRDRPPTQMASFCHSERWEQSRSGDGVPALLSVLPAQHSTSCFWKIKEKEKDVLHLETDLTDEPLCSEGDATQQILTL